ncbi:unnamed protein product [Gadus morhua 'NCC']
MWGGGAGLVVHLHEATLNTETMRHMQQHQHLTASFWRGGGRWSGTFKIETKAIKQSFSELHTTTPVPGPLRAPLLGHGTSVETGNPQGTPSPLGAYLHTAHSLDLRGGFTSTHR